MGLARIEAYWLEGRLDAARAELDRVRDASAGVVVLSQALDSAVDATPYWNQRTPIDLEPFAHRSPGMVHALPNCGIGWATAMKPHWRYWTPKTRPSCESRWHGFLILVPRRRLAWYAGGCETLVFALFPPAPVPRLGRIREV